MTIQTLIGSSSGLSIGARRPLGTAREFFDRQESLDAQGDDQAAPGGNAASQREHAEAAARHKEKVQQRRHGAPQTPAAPVVTSGASAAPAARQGSPASVGAAVRAVDDARADELLAHTQTGAAALWDRRLASAAAPAAKVPAGRDPVADLSPRERELLRHTSAGAAILGYERTLARPA